MLKDSAKDNDNLGEGKGLTEMPLKGLLKFAWKHQSLRLGRVFLSPGWFISDKTTDQTNPLIQTMRSCTPAEIAPPFWKYKAAPNLTFLRITFLKNFGSCLFKFGFHLLIAPAIFVLATFRLNIKTIWIYSDSSQFVEQIYNIAKLITKTINA